MAEQFITLIVPKIVVEAIRSFAAAWSGGAGMWTTPLYTGDTVTHYISSGKINPVIAEQLLAGDAAAIVALIQSQDEDSTVTEAEVQALLDAADISTESGKEAIARLGLSQSPEEVV